jgi:hypothetical protein
MRQRELHSHDPNNRLEAFAGNSETGNPLSDMKNSLVAGVYLVSPTNPPCCSGTDQRIWTCLFYGRWCGLLKEIKVPRIEYRVGSLLPTNFLHRRVP